MGLSIAEVYGGCTPPDGGQREEMRVARSIALAAALALCALIAPAASMPTAQAASAVKITLRCYSNPEKTTIKNIGTVSFKIQKVGSTYQPYSAEPFSVNKTLAPGQSVTYQTGYGASGPTRLYGLYIYNDNGQDGARVKTTVGTFTKHC
jgi:hypothetical protein